MISYRQLQAFVLVFLASLGGCASLPAGKSLDPQDPFERFNRVSFSFNDSVDNAILKPVAEAYKAITPEFARTGVANFFGNLSDIPTALNDLFQGKPKVGGTHLARVAINSTIGMLGLIDFATPMGLERQREDFGQTLGVWGFGSGPYLVLPFLGPSSVRDATGSVVDWATDPVARLPGHESRTALVGLRLMDQRASLLQAKKALDSVGFDRYLLLRDVYLARRKSVVLDGATPRTATGTAVLDAPGAEQKPSAVQEAPPPGDGP